MQIRPISIAELGLLPVTSIFNSSEWISMYKTNLELLGIFNANDEIIGCFYLYKRKRAKVITQISSPPFTPHCGLFFKRFASNLAKKHNENKKVTKAISDYLNKNYKSSIITLVFPPFLKDIHAFYWNKFKVIPNYTYQISLNDSMDEIKKNMDPKTRNLINKAIKDGLKVEQNYDMNLVKSIVMQTMDRKGVDIDKKILNNILFNFSNTENSFSFIVKQNKDILAITFCIYDKGKCYYLLGGYNKGKSHAGAGPMGVTASIEHAIEKGIEMFDFEGSMIPNIESYFRSFGGRLTPYFTINKASFFIESLLKLKMKHRF